MNPWLALLALCAGCQVFDASLVTKPDRGDAALDAGDRDAGAIEDADLDACTRALPPARTTESSDHDDPERVFALRAIFLDQGERWASTGYDLDGLCSTGAEPSVECIPPARSGRPEIDGEGGVDNSLGHQLIPLLALVYPELEPATQEAETRGIGVLLLRVRGWNGEDDDVRVDAVLAQSVFGVAANDAGTAPAELPGDGGLEYDDAGFPTLPAPRWDGTDFWFVRDDGFLAADPEQPRIRDDNAYISGGTLVMRLPDRFPFVLSGSMLGVVFRLTDAVLTVDFDADHRHVGRAVLAGRYAILDILDSIGTSGVCPGTESYVQLARALDLVADIRSTPGSGGPGVKCDAISVGVGFDDGSSAQWGGIYPAGALPTPCERDGGF